MTTTERSNPVASGGSRGAQRSDRVPITRRPQRRPTGRLALVVAVVAMVMGIAVWVVFFSSLLAIRAVEVHGLSTVPRQAIIDAAGVDTGQPLARLDTGDVTRRVAAIPAIAHVDVTRQWPRTVVLTVTERKPAIAVPHGGTYLVYDASGVQFRSDPAAPPGIPELHAQNVPSADVVSAVLEVLAALPPAILGRVTTIRADSLDAIQLALDGGAVTVVWGSADSTARKAAVLGPLMKYPATVYDVSAPDVPVTRE